MILLKLEKTGHSTHVGGYRLVFAVFCVFGKCHVLVRVCEFEIRRKNGDRPALPFE
jgi:hypothetical protein